MSFVSRLVAWMLSDVWFDIVGVRVITTDLGTAPTTM